MDFDIFTMVPTWLHLKQQHYVVSMWMWKWRNELEKIFYNILSHGHGWNYGWKFYNEGGW